MIVVINQRKNPFNDPKTVVDLIEKEPTNIQSRASLLLLGKYYRKLELQDVINKYNINIEKYHDVDVNGLVKIVKKIIEKQFLLKSNLICEYCDRKVYLPKDNKIPHNCATIDHKIPLVEYTDYFNEENFAVCCYDCNQEKGRMSYKEWKLLLNERREYKKFGAIRIGSIRRILSEYIDEIDLNIANKKLKQIANLTEYGRDYLTDYLTKNFTDNFEEIKKDIKTLNVMQVIANNRNKGIFEREIINAEISKYYDGELWRKIHEKHNKT